MNSSQNTTNTTNIIHIKDLYKNHGKNNSFALHIQDFKVKQGELVALVGPSGCGKSTSLDLLSTALRPNVNNDSIFNFCPHDKTYNILTLWKKSKQNKLSSLRQKYIGYILQTGGLLPFLTGYDNILLACPSNIAEQNFKDDLHHLAKTLDIKHLLHKKPAQMSVGERQRFAIARALVHRPKLILADEPVASLDPYNAKLVLELFTHQAKEKNISVIMVSHSPSLAHAAGFRLVQTHISRQNDQIFAQIGEQPLPFAEDSPVGIYNNFKKTN